jgi:hypothetical protein
LLWRKQTPVLGGFDADDYEQRRAWASAEDGTAVPISLVARRGVLDAGPAPTLVYGYGAYETSMDPTFRVPRLSLLDRGVVFAVAHVRGGGELGRHWYEGGRLGTKRNTFTDFVSCARHLVASGVADEHRMVAMGGSAGGLLMGAVANLAPRDFAGILAQVPFVDALTTILDPSLPLTVIEWDEWGDPMHDRDALPTDPGHHQPARHPGALRGTVEVDRPAASRSPLRWAVSGAHGDRGRARRGQWALRDLAGDRVRIRVGARPARAHPGTCRHRCQRLSTSATAAASSSSTNAVANRVRVTGGPR